MQDGSHTGEVEPFSTNSEEGIYWSWQWGAVSGVHFLADQLANSATVGFH